MKKNFFKKLASGLALAMVVTSFAPAAPAFAATATKIVEQGGKKAPQTVYVGKKVDYSLNNVYKTNTYKWFTSNAKIAKITQTGGIVTPVAPGKATIKVNAYKKSTGKLIKAFKLDLDVKLRATSVNIGAEDFELAVGEKKDLDAVKTPANSTDTLRYFSSDEKVATVDTKTGIVTAVAAGEATIKVASKGAWFTANNSKYNKYDEVKVTVVDGLLDVKQTAANKLSLSFSKDVSTTLKASEIAIEEVASHAVQAVKGLSFSKDGKTVTLETYLNFVDKKEYKLTYDKKDFAFTASVGEVASIALKTDKVVYNEETAIKYALYDANGIDITNVIDDSRVTVDVETKSGYTTDGGKKIVLINKGDVATVTVTYHTYKYENGSEITFVAKGTIVAVDETEVTFGNYEKFTIAEGEPDWNKLTNPVTRIAIGDNGFKVYLRVKDSSDNYIAQADIKYTSSNKDVLIVAEDGSLLPVKEGAAYVIATTGKASWTLPVTVVAERKANGVSVDKPSVTVSNSNNANDTAVVTVTVKDQYGDKFDSTIEDVTIVPADKDSGIKLDRPASDKVSFAGKGAIKGSYTYLITAHGKKIPVTVNVVEPSGNTTNEKLVVSATTVDTVISKTDKVEDLASKNIKVQVGKFTGGVLDGYESATIKVTGPNDFVVTGSAISGSAFEFQPVKVVSGSAVEKVQTGTYKIEATTGKNTYTQYIQVTDTQALPSVSVEKITLDSYSNEVATAQAALKVKSAITGKELTIVDTNATAFGKPNVQSVRIESVTVIDTIGNLSVYTTINVGRTITIK